MCVTMALDFAILIKGLEAFHYVDQCNKDQGINIRLRSKVVHSMLLNTADLRKRRQQLAERARAREREGVGGNSPVTEPIPPWTEWYIFLKESF